jgi:DnaJ-class molecular chaperone
MQIEVDDLAARTMARNKGKRKCHLCRGWGQVVKCIQPRAITVVECSHCKGTGLRQGAAR